MSETPYLHDIPLEKAMRVFQTMLRDHDLFSTLGVEEIDLNDNALGRILAKPVIARHCSPHYHASAMDGFAVNSKATMGALPSDPVILSIKEQAQYVDTGDPLPGWADAVIPIENTESLGIDGQVIEVTQIRTPVSIRIRSAVTPWTNVRPVGEDLITGQLIIASGEKLRPADLGAAAAGGVNRIAVAQKPRIGILPTGDELVTLDKEPAPGELSEFNSIVLAAQVREWGGEPKRYAIAQDQLDLLVDRILEIAGECDMILINAGSSAGKEDFTAKAIEKIGCVLVHGIAVRPGHPVILGYVNTPNLEDKRKITPVIGVPGYPVSAAMTCEIFVKPILNIWLGLLAPELEEVTATITRKITSPAGDDDYIRVVLGKVKGKLLAAPIARGAGVTTSLSKADGILVVPRMVQGLEAGESCKIRLYKSINDIERNILTIGSHDMSLDILAQYLSRWNRRLVSSNAGSLGGLLSLKKEEAHFAGSHLLDPTTGTYNTLDVKRILGDRKIWLMSWVKREQGLIIKNGNPKQIRSLQDLIRPDVTYVNRQRGAGTRVLLDYHLKLLGINPAVISGYFQEEYTHLGVAVAVASGRADCGLGVAASAKVMGLDFIHLFDEDYELVFPNEGTDDPLLQPLFLLAVDERLRSEIKKMPGYTVEKMGEMRAVLPSCL